MKINKQDACETMPSSGTLAATSVSYFPLQAFKTFLGKGVTPCMMLMAATAATLRAVGLPVGHAALGCSQAHPF